MNALTFNELPLAVEKLHSKLLEIENLIISKGNVIVNEENQFLTIQQASTFLSLSVATLYGLVSKGLIPVNKKGKRLYFSKMELQDWIVEGKKKTISELQSEAKTFIPKKRA